MRTREKERFVKLGFTENELQIRDSLYKRRESRKNTANWKIIITTEHYDQSKRKHSGYDPNGYLAYFTDYPEDGTYLDTIWFDHPEEFEKICTLYEGQFYQLFDNTTQKRIGYGSLDPDSPIEEIRAHVKQCCSVCQSCFWRGMLYGEIKDIKTTQGWMYTCYHPIYRKEWETEIKNII